MTRKYLTIEEVQQQYLPISKKKIREFVQAHLSVKLIGGRIYVEREALEKWLSSPNVEDYEP